MESFLILAASYTSNTKELSVEKEEREKRMEEIGFLGMGIMGKAMAVNLLRHGFKVTVWNRTLSRVYIFFSTLSAYPFLMFYDLLNMLMMLT